MATTTSALDIVMRREYEEAAREAFFDPDTRNSFVPTVGFETEYSVVKSGGTELLTQDLRDSIVAHDSLLMEQELGAGQLEVKGQPVDLSLGGFQALEAHVRDCECRAVKAASQHDAELIRIGSYPLHPVNRIIRSSAPRYSSIVTWHDVHHSESIPTFIGAHQTTHRTSAEIIALMNSIQFNLAMRSAEDAVRLMNASFALLPQIIAISGNSRFLDYVDTKYSDTRMILWEKTHDTRTPIERITHAPSRVGLPNKYFNDMEDYIRYVAAQPFILNRPGAAFEVGTGLNWTDARLKIRNKKILLEFRPISIQPSVEEDVAVCAFYIGLLEDHLLHERPLPPMAAVDSNRFLAMRYGLQAHFTQINEEGLAYAVAATEVISEGLERAKMGLLSAGFSGGMERLEVLQDRLRRRQAPSDDFADRVEQLQVNGTSFEQALEKAVRECVVKEC